MGGNCCSGKQNTNLAFENAQFDMEDVEFNDSWEENLKDHKEDAPSSGFARKAEKRPKLLPAVQQTLDEVGSLSRSEFDGTKMPTYYVPSRKGYYEGEWSNGFPHGYGKLYMNNGMYYEGPLNRGIPSGNDGLLVYQDGSYKRGEMVNGKLNGKGKFVYKANDLIYDGQWQNDQPHGEGVETHGDGTVYKGKFENGQKHDDDGELKWRNGKVYRGQFRNGYMDGQGQMKMEGGKGVYKGQFERNLKTRGELKTQQGTYYGDFYYGQMSGAGKFQWYDGKVYEGNFENGQLNGQGTITYPSGQRVRGKWDKGQNVWMEVQEN